MGLVLCNVYNERLDGHLIGIDNNQHFEIGTSLYSEQM